MRAIALGSLAEIAFCVDERRAGLPGFMQNRIGADQTKPAFKILPILSQTGREPLDHIANDAHLGVGRHCLYLGCQGALRRSRLDVKTCDPFAQRLRPSRVAWRFGGELSPDFLCPGDVAFLLGCKSKKKAGLGS